MWTCFNFAQSAWISTALALSSTCKQTCTSSSPWGFTVQIFNFSATTEQVLKNLIGSKYSTKLVFFVTICQTRDVRRQYSTPSSNPIKIATVNPCVWKVFAYEQQWQKQQQQQQLDQGCPNGTNTPRGDNFSRYQNLHCDLDLLT